MAVQDVSTLQKRLDQQQEKSGSAPQRQTLSGGFSSAVGKQESLPRTTMAGGFQAAMSGTNGETTDVSKIAAGMMQEDNPLMTRAKTQGLQVANRRGLLNSSVAAGESMNQVLDRIVPMASQESQQRHATQLSDRQFGQRLQENEQQFGHARKLSEQEYQQASRLSDQEFEQQFQMSREEYQQNLEIQARDQTFQKDLSYQEYEQASDLSDQQFEQQMGLSREEYRQNLELQARDQAFTSSENAKDRKANAKLARLQIASDQQLANLDATTRTTLMTMESDMRERLTQMELGSDSQVAVADMVTSMNSQYQSAVNSILSNPNIPAEERNKMLQSAGDLLNKQMDMSGSLFGVDFEWIDDAFDLSGTTPSDDGKGKGKGKGGKGKGGKTQTNGNSTTDADRGGNSGDGGAGGYGNSGNHGNAGTNTPGGGGYGSSLY